MNKLILCLVISLFCINLISAVPPVTQVKQFTEGYIIETPQDNVLKVNQDYLFQFHVFNITNGVQLITNLSCNLHLYNSFGYSQYEGYANMPEDTSDYCFNVTKGNFTEIDTYYYFIQCNSSLYGGYDSSELIVTSSGKTESGSNIAFNIIAIILIYGISFIGLFKKDYYITLIGGMAMMFLGIYLFNEGIIIFRDDLTRYISYLTIGLGAGLSIASGIAVITDNLD